MGSCHYESARSFLIQMFISPIKKAKVKYSTQVLCGDEKVASCFTDQTLNTILPSDNSIPRFYKST